jgi:hypothetical protein
MRGNGIGQGTQPFLQRKVTTAKGTHELLLGPSFGRTVVTVAVCLTLLFLTLAGAVPAAAGLNALMRLRF